MNLARPVVTRALVIMGVIFVGFGAAPAPIQEAARPVVDWRRAGGPLFVFQDAGEPGEADEAQPTLERDADPETAWNGSTMTMRDGARVIMRLPPSTQPFDQMVADAANRHGLDPKLLHALVAVESAYRPQAVSPAGAGGLAQLMPGTASDLGVRDRFDPADNLNGGAAYLAEQLLRFGDVRLALAAYNSGPHRVARLGRVPDIAETRAYVTAVTECYLTLAAGRRIRSRADCGQ